MADKQTLKKNFQDGFWKGYGQLRLKERDAARDELFAALGLSKRSPVQFSYYLRGRLEPKASQAQAIEAVFLRYGITEVWGGKE